MEGLSPTLALLLHLRFGLQRGQSIRQSVQQFCETQPTPLAQTLRQWLIRRETGLSPMDLLTAGQSVQLQTLLRVMDRGLQGESVQAILLVLEDEIRGASQDELDQFLAVLPFKMLIPLLLLQFPAFLVLLLGPLLKDLLHSL